MSTWLICFRSRLCLSNILGSRHIYQGILVKNTHPALSKNYCNNVDISLKASASVEHTIKTFNEIHRFSGVRMGSALIKVKWYQSILAAIVIPSSLVLYYFELIDSSWAISVIIPGITFALNLYGIASFFQNGVGFLYLSEDETTLKISYLDSRGNRIDEEFRVDDVVPFLDAPRPPTDYLYKQILFYSSDTKKFKMFLKLGQITDKDKFDKVFGPLEYKKE